MAALETVDVPGVEILSAGGPIHGVGSPPEGDFWSADELEQIADANRELAGELQAPNKIGHSDAQALLLNSGMIAPTPGEMPAVGWLDGSTFRVEERDGVAKLLADAKDVPAKFADLLESKAYRTRSVELSRVTSQEQVVDGKPKVYDWVVTGLAWLGAKLPAVRTLDDIVALYEHEEIDLPKARAYIVYAAGSVVWEPEAGFQDLRDDVNEALNGPPTGGMVDPRFWVRDIATSLDKALVEDWYDDGNDGWVVPFTRDASDQITIAPSSDWIAVEQGWVEAARDLEARVTVPPRRADIRREVSDSTFTAEQRKAFADATGLEEDKVTDEMLAATAELVAPKTENDDPVDADAQRDFERKLEEATQAANDRVAKVERKLFEQDRDSFIESVLRDGKAAPGQRDEIVAMYEEAPASARKFFESAPVNEQFAREYGSESDQITDEDREAEEKSYEADASNRLGIPEGALL